MGQVCRVTECQSRHLTNTYTDTRPFLLRTYTSQESNPSHYRRYNDHLSVLEGNSGRKVGLAERPMTPANVIRAIFSYQFKF